MPPGSLLIYSGVKLVLELWLGLQEALITERLGLNQVPERKCEPIGEGGMSVCSAVVGEE